MHLKRAKFSCIHWFGSLINVLIVSGCASNSNMWRSSEHAEITPFAQQTLQVLGVENIQVRDNELLYLRMYVSDDFKQLDLLQERLRILDAIRDRAIDYSIELLSITEDYYRESERVAAYAESLQTNLAGAIITAKLLTEEEWKEKLEHIKKQTRFLDALREFQTVVNSTSRYYEDLISEIENTLLQNVRQEFDKRIQREFGVTLAYLDTLYNTRDQLFLGVTALEKYKSGNKKALLNYWKNTTPYNQRIMHDTQPNDGLVQEYSAQLQADIERNNALIRATDTDTQDYLKTRNELETQEDQIYRALAAARIQFVTWSRAHKALANGVKDPAKWLKLGEAAAKLALKLI